MGAFEWLLEAVKKARLFRRDKVSVEHKVRACLMYMSGLSTRDMTVRTGLIPASHVAVHYWLRKVKGLVQTFESKVRQTIAIDEDRVEGEWSPCLRLGCDRYGF